MKRGKLFWQLALVFVVALVGYAVVFGWIEHRRVVKGPWVVTFTNENESPAIIVNQSALGIHDVRVIFREATTPTNPVQAIEFSQARAVPFAVPFGQCVFQDTTVLPGTVKGTARACENSIACTGLVGVVASRKMTRTS